MSRLSRLPSLDLRLKLRDFRLMVAIGDSASLGRAAALLNISQPAVTRALRDLEARLGVTLFDRSRQGVRPTVQGASLLRHARAIMAEVAAAGGALAGAEAGQEGPVSIGVLISAAGLLPRTLARFHAERPRVTVHLEEATNDVLMRALRAGELDMVVGRLPAFRNREGILQEQLYLEAGCIVAGPGHPLGDGRKVAPADLVGQDWVMPPPQTTLRRRLDAMFREAGLEPPHPAIESVSLVINQALIAELPLLGAVSRPIAERWVRQGTACILALPEDMLTGPVGIATARDRTPSPAAAALMQTMRTVAASLGAERVPES